MADGPVKLVTKPTALSEAQKDAVAVLEKALERARSGDIVWAGIALVMTNGSMHSTHSEWVGGAAQTLGAVAWLQHRVCQTIE